MTSATNQPLWLSIEAKIAELDASAFDDAAKESTVKRLAEDLDAAGFNVSRHAANLISLRHAVDARAKVGRPMMTDFEAATQALSLDDVANPIQATIALAQNLGSDWPAMKDLDRRGDLRTIVNGIRLDLLVAEANELAGDQGIRYLIENEIAESTILQRLEIDQAKLDAVKAAIAAERAEIARVTGLLKEVEGQDEVSRAKHLINKDVSDDMILEVAGLAQAVIDEAKQALEKEIKEKQRLAAEAEAAKKAAAEGPKLEDISSDDMLEHIEAIREIMEFSDDPGEIAAMCEQSNIPKALIEIATTSPDKLDELEAAAEG
jgi:hypothetical protein